jgi:hypothetical protein
MRNAWSGRVFRSSLPDALAWKLALWCFDEIAAGGIRLAAVRVKTGPCLAVTHIPVEPLFNQTLHLTPVLAQRMIRALKKHKPKRMPSLVEL